jgi:hypothetical protein
MKVDNPEFHESGADVGEIVKCRQCPLDDFDDECILWIRHHNIQCPTKENYADACKAVESTES